MGHFTDLLTEFLEPFPLLYSERPRMSFKYACKCLNFCIDALHELVLICTFQEVLNTFNFLLNILSPLPSYHHSCFVLKSD